MLVKCPSCGGKIRLSTGQFNLKDARVRYLCQECEQIVMIDLIKDVIPTSSAADSAAETAHEYRILVADDTDSFLRVVEDLLTKEGFIVVTAKDGMDALKKVNEQRPDAIVLDLFMPNMTGFEVLKTLKTSTGYKHLRNIPVLVTSGVYKAAEVQMIHDLGASGFISKEAVPELLAYRLKKLLFHSSQSEVSA